MSQWVWPVALGGALLAGSAAAAPVPEKKDSPEVQALLKERRDVLKQEVLALSDQFEAGRGPLTPLLAASRELLKAELELATRPTERVAAHERHFSATRRWEQIVKDAYDARRMTAAAFFEMRGARLEAEIGLRRAGGKPKPEGK